MRSKFRPGQNLIMDEESGLTVWSDEVKKDYQGQVVRVGYADERHPQELVPHLARVENPVISRAVALVTAFVCASSFSTVISGVSAKVGAASHLFMQI